MPGAGRVVIRPASVDDLDDAQRLERATFTSHSISPRQMRYLQRNAKAVFLIARRSGELAGDAIALIRRNPAGSSSGRIYSLVVDPNHRGQNIGRKLMVALMKSLADRGVGRVYLEVAQANVGAIGLYEQLGFRIIKSLRHYYGRGDHGVHMLYEFPDR